MNWKRPIAFNGALKHAKTFSTERFAGSTIGVVQYFATL
jgi:hypothetical protein